MELNLNTPVSSLGYGVVGQAFLKNLHNKGVKVAFFPIGNVSWHGDDEFKGIVEETMQNARFYNPDAPCLRIFHQFSLDSFIGKSRRIGFPIFELNTFTEQEKHHLNSIDELLVASEWAKNVVEDNSIRTPTKVVPFGVDTSVFYLHQGERESRPSWSKGNTVFLNVGKWEVRKGHNELLEAFNQAFEPGDNVELWMLNDNMFIGNENDAWRRKYVESKMGAHIKFFPRLDTQDQLRKLYNHVDCLVTPSHAEGWGLPNLEAMACGVHLITTGYSGHTQYINEDAVRIVKPDRMEKADDGRWFHGQGEWCSYPLSRLVDELRKFHDYRQSDSYQLNDAGVQLANKFTWSKATDKLIEAIYG